MINVSRSVFSYHLISSSDKCCHWKMMENFLIPSVSLIAAPPGHFSISVVDGSIGCLGCMLTPQFPSMDEKRGSFFFHLFLRNGNVSLEFLALDLVGHLITHHQQLFGPKIHPKYFIISKCYKWHLDPSQIWLLGIKKMWKDPRNSIPEKIQNQNLFCKAFFSWNIWPAIFQQNQCSLP